jgi:hypothetical protein
MMIVLERHAILINGALRWQGAPLKESRNDWNPD